MTRRSIAAALSAAMAPTLALALAACGGGGTDAADAAAQAADDPQSVSGTVTWWDTSDATNEAPAFKELVKRFEKRYPKIDVNYVNVPFDGADDKFKTAAQAGDGAPDVMRADVGWTTTFAALGYLQPLDGTPALAGSDDYLSVPARTNSYQGKTYGVPEVTDTLGLLYNKELFAKAGIHSPPKTWEEATDAAKRIERKVPGTTGFFVNADSYFLLPFLYGEGGDVVDAKTKRVTIDSPEVRAAVDTAKGLATNGVGATDTSTNKYTNMLDGFKNGTVAMMLNGPWSVSDVLTGSAYRKQENLGVATVPAGPKGRGGPVGGHNLSVYAGSPNLAASYLFVRFLNSADSQAYVAERNSTMPTRQSVYDRAEVEGNDVIAKFRQPLDGARPRPAAPGAGDLYDMVTPFYEKIMGGQSSTADALREAQRKVKGAVPGYES